MIKPKQNEWARRVFDPYETLLLKKNFTHFYLSGKIPQTDPRKGLLITPNHFSWWDGFFIDYAARKCYSRNFHIIMLEEQLKKYSFFRRLGAFSIEPSNTKKIAESLNFASQILSDPQNLLVYYPQGKIEPYDIYPAIKPGIKFLLKYNNGIQIVPAAFRIEFNNRKKPDIYLRFGDILDGRDVCSSYDLFTSAFTNNIERLTSAVHHNLPRKDIFMQVDR